MGKRHSLVPAFVLLAVLALLLACSRFTTVPGAASPTAPPRFAEIDYWTAWERASWVATVLGLPIAIIAISIAGFELKRTADELSRKPKLSISFEQRDLAHKVLKLERRPELDNSATGVVYVVVTNIGNRSSSQLNSTIAIDGRIRPARRSGPSQVPNEDRVSFIRRPIDGTLIAKRDEPFVHPGMSSIAAMPLIFPDEARTYEIIGV